MEEEAGQGTNSFPKNDKKILIVEDDETILRLLKKFFDARGYHVLAEKDGLKVVERLKAEKPAIVLTGMQMPSVSGVDLVEFIRHNVKEMPIIVMTAYPYLRFEKKRRE